MCGKSHEVGHGFVHIVPDAGDDGERRGGDFFAKLELVERGEVEAEFRRRLYQREIDILRTQPNDPDMDALAAWMVGRYPGIE